MKCLENGGSNRNIETTVYNNKSMTFILGLPKNFLACNKKGYVMNLLLFRLSVSEGHDAAYNVE